MKSPIENFSEITFAASPLAYRPSPCLSSNNRCNIPRYTAQTKTTIKSTKQLPPTLLPPRGENRKQRVWKTATIAFAITAVAIRSVIFGCPLKIRVSPKKIKKYNVRNDIASQLSYVVPLPELDVKPVLSDVLDESAHKFHTLTSLLSCPDQASFPWSAHIIVPPKKIVKKLEHNF